MTKFKEGDRVVRVHGSFKDTVKSGEYVVDWSDWCDVSFDGDDGTYDVRKFELVQDNWSDWEDTQFNYHSKWYILCDYESKRINGVTSSRIKLPTATKVSDLTGTVQMVGGKPDWSTYKE